MIRINLAPTRARRLGLPRLPAFNLGVLFLIVYVVAIAGAGYSWWSLSRQEAQLGAEVARLSRELAVLQAVVGQRAQARARLAELQQRVKVFGELTRGQERPIVLLDAFAASVPPDLWITVLEERSSVLRITGSAFSTTAVADFMANLRRSERFKDVDIIVARQDPSKTPRLVTFEVTCRFEG